MYTFTGMQGHELARRIVYSVWSLMIPPDLEKG